MVCDWIIFCEDARRDKQTNKLSMIGTFDAVRRKSTVPGEPPGPVVQATMFIVMKFLGTPGETAEITLNICDPVGKTIAGGVMGKPKLGPVGTLEFVTEMKRVVFNDAGAYSARVYTNRTFNKATTITVFDVR